MGMCFRVSGGAFFRLPAPSALSCFSYPSPPINLPNCFCSFHAFLLFLFLSGESSIARVESVSACLQTDLSVEVSSVGVFLYLRWKVGKEEEEAIFFTLSSFQSRLHFRTKTRDWQKKYLAANRRTLRRSRRRIFRVRHFPFSSFCEIVSVPSSSFLLLFPLRSPWRCGCQKSKLEEGRYDGSSKQKRKE